MLPSRWYLWLLKEECREGWLAGAAGLLVATASAPASIVMVTPCRCFTFVYVVTYVYRICCTYAGAAVMALPGGHLVSGTTHRLSGLGQSCGEKLCALYMGLNGDSSRLDGRLESPIAYAHMHAQCTLLTTDGEAIHACTCSFCCRGAGYTCRGIGMQLVGSSRLSPHPGPETLPRLRTARSCTSSRMTPMTWSAR